MFSICSNTPMSDLTPMAERHARALNELMELGMALARKLQDRAMAAETAEEERAATLAFHRMSRSVRQTLHLEAQLERLRRRMLHEELEAERRAPVTESPAARAAREAVVVERRCIVREAVEEAIWTEVGDDFMAEAMVEQLEKIVEAEALDAGFLKKPIETCIAELRAAIGLAAKADAGPTPSAHPRAGGDPSGAAVAAAAGTSGEDGDGSPPLAADSS
jgi:hypothetical protein